MIGGLPISAPPVYNRAPLPRPLPVRPQPQPVVRAQSEDPPARPVAPLPPPPITMPAPETFGIHVVVAEVQPKPIPEPAAAPPAVPKPSEEWLPLFQRLDALGMTSFQFVPQGDGCRFVCVLASGRQVEAVGQSRADVLRDVLAQAEAIP